MKRKVGFIALILTLAIAVCGFVGCSLFDETDSLRISRYPRIVYHANEDLTGETFMKVVLTKDGKATPLELTFKDASTLVGEADGTTYEFDVANFDLSTESNEARRTATISYDTVYATFQYQVVGVKTFVINNVDELNNFRDAVNRGDADYTSANTIVELQTDINLTGTAWVPISNYYRSKQTADMVNWFKGEFRGNNHTITGLTNKGLVYEGLEHSVGTNSTTVAGTVEINYGLFGCVFGARIHDIKFVNVDIAEINAKTANEAARIVGDGVGAVAGYSWGNSEFKNITVNGSIAGYDDVGGIVGMARGASDEVKFINCNVSADLTAMRRAAGIVGQCGPIAAVTFVDCIVSGGIIGAQFNNDAFNTKAGEMREAYVAKIERENPDLPKGRLASDYGKPYNELSEKDKKANEWKKVITKEMFDPWRETYKSYGYAMVTSGYYSIAGIATKTGKDTIPTFTNCSFTGTHNANEGVFNEYANS